MKPVFQTRRGTEGNCWAACLASMLEVSLEQTDHCGAPHTEWWHNTQRFLARHGLFYVEVPFPPEREDGTRDLPITVPPDGTLLMIGCNTERGLPHVIIGRLRHTFDATDEGMKVTGWEIEVVHDPFPGGSEITAMDALLLLCRLEK